MQLAPKVEIVNDDDVRPNDARTSSLSAEFRSDFTLFQFPVLSFVSRGAFTLQPPDVQNLQAGYHCFFAGVRKLEEFA
jgi:hypothetical protein